MTLDRQRLTKRLYEAGYPDWLVEELASGKKFVPIPADASIDPGHLPDGYALQEISFKSGHTYKAIIPERVLMHVGDKENPDELWNVYQEILDHERALMGKREVDLGVSFFGQEVRDSYEVAVINSLLVGEGKTPLAEYKPAITSRYEGREAVARAVEEIAKVYLGVQEVEKFRPSDVLQHVTDTMTVTRQRRVRCYKGSHWEWDVESEAVPVQVVRERLSSVSGLEDAALGMIYRKSPKDAKEDAARRNELRTYINMRYLAKTGKQMPLVTTEAEGTEDVAKAEEAKKAGQRRPRK